MKSYTNLEQSNKLAKFLPLESADMYYDGFGRLPQGYAYTLISTNSFEYDKPCWSLAALLNFLREIDFFPNIEADEHGVTMSVCYYDDEEEELLHPMHDITTEAGNFVDACYEMILKLHELKML